MNMTSIDCEIFDPLLLYNTWSSARWAKALDYTSNARGEERKAADKRIADSHTSSTTERVSEHLQASQSVSERLRASQNVSERLKASQSVSERLKTS